MFPRTNFIETRYKLFDKENNRRTLKPLNILVEPRENYYFPGMQLETVQLIDFF